MATDAPALFDGAMALNDASFAAGHYEAAYHALMAALHLAQDRGDEARLLRVARVADVQGRHVDSLSPSHNISTQSAEGRGHDSLFHLAARD